MYFNLKIKHMNVLITGSDGFIGRHIRKHLRKENNVYGIDLKNDNNLDSTIIADVRDKKFFDLVPKDIDLIINLAAVHREPGHSRNEYFDTNIAGAENVCEFAERVNCKRIIFTSSISPYGVSESTKDEKTKPCPVTPYGESKLQAEEIHLKWQKSNSDERILTIVRPGVVYGEGEGGNMTRLVKAVKRGYFIYMSNRQTLKAGVYIKELINMIFWSHTKQINNELAKSVMFNATIWPNPTISDYVSTICQCYKIKRFIPSVPYFLLILMAYIFEAIYYILPSQNPLSPVRIRKLVRPNSIKPSYLINNSYKYLFSLESSFSDWRDSSKKDWL